MKLAKYLQNKGISQTAFAAEIRVTQVTVNRYVQDLRTPDLHTIWAIEKATNGAVSAADWPAKPRKKTVGKRKSASSKQAMAAAS